MPRRNEAFWKDVVGAELKLNFKRRGCGVAA
jgi:hypothetical protein